MPMISREQLLQQDVPFLKLLGLNYTSHAPGEAEFSVCIEPKHLRSGGILHGGVTCTLLDTTMGLAAFTSSEDQRLLVTSQMNLHFVRPCKAGETINARAVVKHAGRQTVVVEGQILTSTNELVAMGTGTYMFIGNA